MSIDQSLSSSGVIIWDEVGSIEMFTVIKTPPKKEVILRIRAIIVTLKELIQRYNITIVVIESLPFGLNSTSVRPLAALHMCIQNMCMDLDVMFTEAHVTKVKKNATGKGSAKKGDMWEALEIDSPTFVALIEDAGYKKTTGRADLADSYWIYKLYKKENA